MIKAVKTVAQFKALEFIEENFEPQSFTYELIDDETVRITDHTWDCMDISYVGGVIVTKCVD